MDLYRCAPLTVNPTNDTYVCCITSYCIPLTNFVCLIIKWHTKRIFLPELLFIFLREWIDCYLSMRILNSKMGNAKGEGEELHKVFNCNTNLDLAKSYIFSYFCIWWKHQKKSKWRREFKFALTRPTLFLTEICYARNNSIIQKDNMKCSISISNQSQSPK